MKKLETPAPPCVTSPLCWGHAFPCLCLSPPTMVPPTPVRSPIGPIAYVFPQWQNEAAPG